MWRWKLSFALRWCQYYKWLLVHPVASIEGTNTIACYKDFRQFLYKKNLKRFSFNYNTNLVKIIDRRVININKQWWKMKINLQVDIKICINNPNELSTQQDQLHESKCISKQRLQQEVAWHCKEPKLIFKVGTKSLNMQSNDFGEDRTYKLPFYCIDTTLTLFLCDKHVVLCDLVIALQGNIRAFRIQEQMAYTSFAKQISLLHGQRCMSLL